VSAKQLETISSYVDIGLAEGAECLIGGTRALPGGELDSGYFFEPTVLKGRNGMRVFQEEIFGPVLAVIPFSNDDEAVAIANDSIYGLAGGVQSTNIERAQGIANRMRTGTVWINDYHMLTPQQPFGGYKQSGIGRELGVEGYRAYQQIKHVHTNPSTKKEDYLQFAALSSEI
jgi:aldehyde dehydrogenase (NAD+)